MQVKVSSRGLDASNLELAAVRFATDAGDSSKGGAIIC